MEWGRRMDLEEETLAKVNQIVCVGVGMGVCL